MLRSRFLAAVLAGLLVPAFTFADDPKTPQEKLEAQQKQLDEKLTKLLNEIASVKEKIQAIEKTVTRYDLSETNYMIVELGQQVDKLQRELRTAQKSPSDYAKMPPGGKSESKKIGAGTLRLINEYSVQQQVMVNGSAYFVNPGDTIHVSVPAGKFTYQIVGHHDARQTRSVDANRVFETRMHP